jgi:hypothetical protein
MSQPGEQTVIVEEPPPAQQPRTRAQVLLGRTLRIVDAGPRPFFQAALVSLTLTCGLAILIALTIRPGGPLPEPQRDAILISLAGLGLVGVLTLATVVIPYSTRAARLDRVIAPAQRAAIWLALTLWFPLITIIAYYRGESTLPLTQVWINFGYNDKRWLTAAYLVCSLAPMVLLVLAARVLEAGRAHPVTWRAWLRNLTPRRHTGRARAGAPAAGAVAAGTGVISTGAVAAATVSTSSGVPDAAVADAGVADAGVADAGAADTGTADAGTADAGTALEAPAASPAGDQERVTFAAFRFPGAGFIRVTAGLLTALGLAYYFYGPPWYLNRASPSTALLYQEDLYLVGLQAISKGAVPYIGPAAIQYGPGSQWFAYLYMRHFATFSVVGFREAWAMFEWVGASFLFVVFFLALGYIRGLIATLLSALIYPALHQMEFIPHGAYTGLIAWANPLRYAGAISLLLLLPAAIRRAPAWRGLLGALVLGMLWGLLSYVAQENLAAGAVGALVLGVLLLLSGSASRRAVLSSLLAVVAGFLVAWLPVVWFYAGRGLLGRFVYLYFLDPRAVAEGYSNTPWGGLHPNVAEIALDAPWTHMYYILPFVLAVLALLAVVKFAPFRVAMDWSKERILLVSSLVTTILLYQGAMLRADADHITGTMLVVPFMVISVATVLPRALGGRRWYTLGLAGALIFAASFLLLPVKSYTFRSISAQAQAPARDRQRLAAEKVLPTPSILADQRVGAGLWDRPSGCCQSFTEPMTNFTELATQIHEIVGNRVTYVENFMAGYTGVIDFVADLRPAPVPLDLRTMVFTKQQEISYLNTFRISVLPKTQALITDNLLTSQVRAFVRHYPHYQLIALQWFHHWHHPHVYWVLLSKPDSLSALRADGVKASAVF